MLLLAETVILLDPVPLVRETVNHPQGAEAAQSQLAPVLMLTVVPPAAAPADQLVGEIAYVQDATSRMTVINALPTFPAASRALTSKTFDPLHNEMPFADQFSVPAATPVAPLQRFDHVT